MNEQQTQAVPAKHMTEKEAKKRIDEMTLIDGFLFDNTIEDEEDAKIVVGKILKAVYNREFVIAGVTSQKTIQAVDTIYHGIRFDAHITTDPDTGQAVATVYDVEMENRPSDRKYLPKRLRYYGALHDVKKLDAGDDYMSLPDFVTITILSYDPFSAGDMYYEASTVITTHPMILYQDGVRHIFLNCNGKPNFKDNEGNAIITEEHSKRLQEMLKYIVSGQKPASANEDIDAVEKVVTKVKGRKGVTIDYMKQWDLLLSIKRETRQETREEDALEAIRFDREEGIQEETTRKRLKRMGYDEASINELFAKAYEEEAAPVGAGTDTAENTDL